MVQSIKVIHATPDMFFGRGSIDIDFLEPFRKHTLIINYASEHWGPDRSFLLRLYELLESSGFDFWMLSHEPSDHQLKPKLVFYPWWYVYGVKSFEDIDIAAPRTKVLGCLHGNPRPHRIAHYFAAKNRFDPEKSYITIYRATKTRVGGHCSWRADDVELSQQEKDYWELLYRDLPPRENSISDKTIQIPALDDAYVHIVTETTVIDRIFLSEKTWKPIAAGQLFLHFGNPGTVSFLRSIGVDTFDDIIDHESYDHITDWRQRMRRIHDIAQDIMAQDIEKIWKQTLARRQLNKQRFFAGEFHGSFKFEIIDEHVPRR